MLIVARMASGPDTQDIVVERTPEGKKLRMQVPAPSGRLYANEMVDRPYTGFGITDDAQSHIVATCSGRLHSKSSLLLAYPPHSA